MARRTGEVLVLAPVAPNIMQAVGFIAVIL